MSGAIDRKLVTMPGVSVSPEVLLHRTLQKLLRIKAVTVVIQWDDDTMDVDWSSQPAGHLCMAAMILNEQARRIAIGEDDGA